MSVPGVSAVAPAHPSNHVHAHHQVARTDPDGDGDNDQGVSAAKESSERASSRKVDIRV